MTPPPRGPRCSTAHRGRPAGPRVRSPWGRGSLLGKPSPALRRGSRLGRAVCAWVTEMGEGSWMDSHPRRGVRVPAASPLVPSAGPPPPGSFLGLLAARSPAATSSGRRNQLPRTWWLKTTAINFLTVGPSLFGAITQSLQSALHTAEGFPETPLHERLGHISASRRLRGPCGSVQAGGVEPALGGCFPGWSSAQPGGRCRVALLLRWGNRGAGRWRGSPRCPPPAPLPSPPPAPPPEPLAGSLRVRGLL